MTKNIRERSLEIPTAGVADIVSSVELATAVLF